MTYTIVCVYGDGREQVWSVRDTLKGAKIALANARRKAEKYGYVTAEMRESA
jgi:hypothetical protein